jgi:hypothetical protein
MKKIVPVKYIGNYLKRFGYHETLAEKIYDKENDWYYLFGQSSPVTSAEVEEIGNDILLDILVYFLVHIKEFTILKKSDIINQLKVLFHI